MFVVSWCVMEKRIGGIGREERRESVVIEQVKSDSSNGARPFARKALVRLLMISIVTWHSSLGDIDHTYGVI